MGIILDSSVLIAAERQRFDLPAFLQVHARDTFHLAAITASELLHGIERATDPHIKSRRQRFVEGTLTDFAIIPFGLAEARHHSRLWAKLEERGQIIGPHDLEIAATALAVGFALATLNHTEFKRVPGLTLIDVAVFLRQAVK